MQLLLLFNEYIGLQYKMQSVITVTNLRNPSLLWHLHQTANKPNLKSFDGLLVWI